MMATGAVYDVIELGVSTPKHVKKDVLSSGEVGYIGASIKSINDIKVGDTITNFNDPCDEALPGYKPMKSMVYSGIYPVETNKYDHLKEALEKLKLNDASLTYEPETSQSLGFGFRCGFLGLLHMDIIKTRIEREFNIDVILTSPSVIYEIILTDGSVINIDSPVKMPERVKPFKKA